MTGKYPEDHNLISNRKNFLSALYFRLKRRTDERMYISKNNKKMVTTQAFLIGNACDTIKTWS